MFKSDLSLLLALDGSRDVSIGTRPTTMLYYDHHQLETLIVPFDALSKGFRARCFS